jgi:hypothetical protein
VHGEVASSVKSGEFAVEHGLPEYGLDCHLPFSVEPVTVLGRDERAHPGVPAALPPGAGGLALAGVRWDQQRDPLRSETVHLLVVPVAGIRDDNVGLVEDPDLPQLPAGRASSARSITGSGV